jgi:SAM-dependent methyltransferase
LDDLTASPGSSGHEPQPDDWDQHWGSFGGAAGGAPANRYRQAVVSELLGPVADGAKILDIGSGQGELSLSLAQTFPEAEVWGIEYSAEGVHRAVEQAGDAAKTVRFSQRDLLVPTDLPPEQAGWADLAVCSEVLEHVDEPQELLRNAKAYLGPNCKLVVTVPGGPRSAFDRHIGHRQHFTPLTLRNLLESSGFRVERTLRAGFPFFNLYRLTVIARGTRLIEDLRQDGPGAGDSWSTRTAFAVFDRLFHYNLRSSPFGWQIVAVARPSGRTTPNEAL